MTEKRFIALRAVAGIAGLVLAGSLATAPAIAGGEDKDKGGNGRSEEAHQNAPGQQRDEEAGNPQPGNGNGTPPEHAGGPAAQSPPPGQAKPQSRPAKPAKPQQAQRPARPAKPAKPAHPAHSARPAKPAKPVAAAPKPANPRAKAGKTTICHATGSATNPYVTITISDNALPAHARHQDGRDLIPAPAGGCPVDAAKAGTRAAAKGGPAAPGREQTPAAPALTPSLSEVLGMVESSDEAPAGQVLGVVAEGGAAPQSLPRLRDTIDEAPSVTRRESGAPVARPAAGRLPFTGLETALVALFGALLVLIGVLCRQLGRAPRAAQ